MEQYEFILILVGIICGSVVASLGLYLEYLKVKRNR